MPFTPLHMGPGLLVKALLQGSFSLTLFGWTQILMDLQPLLAIITGEGQLHGFSHTYLGASLIALIAALTGKHLAEWGLSLMRLPRLPSSPIITWPVVFFSAFVGSYSHVVLDSIMHSDMSPWFPFSDAHFLLGWISIEALHQFCLYSGLIGATLFYLIQWWQAKRHARHH